MGFIAHGGTLHQFIEHNNNIASKFIDERCDIFGYDEGEDRDAQPPRQMESVMLSMIKYVAIHETITKEWSQNADPGRTDGVRENP